MTVKVVGTKQIIAEIREFGGMGWFKFQSTATHLDAGEGLVQVLTEILGDAWNVDDDEDDFFLFKPVAAPGGVVVQFDHAWDPKAFVKFLEAVAERLSELGYSGKIRNQEYELPPFKYHESQSLAATVRLAGGPWAGTHRDVPQWNFDPDTKEEIVSFALQWCQLPDARYFFATGPVSIECEKGDLGHLVAAAWGQKGNIQITAQADAKSARHVMIHCYAYLLFELSSDPQGADTTWSTKVDELRQVLLDLSPYMTYGYIKRARMGEGAIDCSWQTVWPPVDAIVRGAGVRSSALLTEMAYDAFPLQLIASAVLDRPLDLEDWHVEDTGASKVFLAQKSAEQWFRDEPSDQAVAKARQDLQPILMTRDILIAEQKAWNERAKP